MQNYFYVLSYIKSSRYSLEVMKGMQISYLEAFFTAWQTKKELAKPWQKHFNLGKCLQGYSV